MIISGYMNNKTSRNTYMDYIHIYVHELMVKYAAHMNEILRTDATKLVSSSVFIKMATHLPTEVN